ncbi:predicted protein [Histoplasma capsulatum H143]|uniref:Uncharacterized protein n=1 Tax=Ajellomyces capsulatus (strain H143) TaxID=544712 RepID=C6HJS6_AJECH|nr:predicted protein [Histoplasma capsulatum H143]
MATVDRRRSCTLVACGEPRLALTEERLERSVAFMVAAAARDVEEERGESDWPDGISAELANVRAW